MTISRTGRLFQPITVWLEHDQYTQAKNLGINLTRATRDGVARAIEKCEQQDTGNPGLSTAQDCQA